MEQCRSGSPISHFFGLLEEERSSLWLPSKQIRAPGSGSSGALRTSPLCQTATSPVMKSPGHIVAPSACCPELYIWFLTARPTSRLGRIHLFWTGEREQPARRACKTPRYPYRKPSQLHKSPSPINTFSANEDRFRILTKAPDTHARIRHRSGADLNDFFSTLYKYFP